MAAGAVDDREPEADAERVAGQARELVASGAVPDAIRLLTDALPRHDGAARGRVLLGLAQAHAVSGELVDAVRAAAGACELFRAAGERGAECDALISLAGALRRAGELPAAFSQLERAEDVARELADDRRLGSALRNLGVVCSLLGRHQQALSYLEEALRRQQGTELAQGLLQTRLSLLNARNRHAQSLPDPGQVRARSATLLPEWLALAAEAAEAGAPHLQLMALGNHAITLRDSGDHRGAIEALTALLPRYRQMGMRPNEGICWQHLGAAHAACGEHAQARECFEAAVQIHETAGSLDDLRDSLEGLSHALEALGDYRAALSALRRVREVEAKLNADKVHASATQREVRLELARLTNQWVQLAHKDPLTGLTNRRGLDAWWPEAFERASQGATLALLLIDIDHFKSINDRFGHAVGDRVLSAVAQRLEANCRASDLAVRYGGEEFLLAMRDADLAAATDAARRLRQSVASHPWRDVADGLAVTISVGVAEAAEAPDWEALVALADRRLYAAKVGGRDRVVADGAGVTSPG